MSQNLAVPSSWQEELIEYGEDELEDMNIKAAESFGTEDFRDYMEAVHGVSADDCAAVAGYVGSQQELSGEVKKFITVKTEGGALKIPMVEMTPDAEVAVELVSQGTQTGPLEEHGLRKMYEPSDTSNDLVAPDNGPAHMHRCRGEDRSAKQVIWQEGVADETIS